MNDVRKMIYGTIIGFFVFLGFWFSIVYISACGFTLTCHRGDLNVVRTPIPTLIPASHDAAEMPMSGGSEGECAVHAADFIGAWASAGAPETEPFPFEDVNGKSCTGVFAEIQPLLSDNGTWKTGTLGCTSCHNSELAERSAGLDLSSYSAITSSGVLGNSWESSKLYQVLQMGLSPAGHSEDVSAENPLIYAGTVSAAEEPTPAP